MLQAATWCETILFSLPEDSPSIEQIQSKFPELVVIAQVGISYAVSIPSSALISAMFDMVFAALPDPTPADLQELQRLVDEQLTKGFVSTPTN